MGDGRADITAEMVMVDHVVDQSGPWILHLYLQTSPFRVMLPAELRTVMLLPKKAVSQHQQSHQQHS